MKILLIAIAFLAQISLLHAAPLNKSVMESFKNAAQQMETLEKKHPEVFKNLPKSNDLTIDMSPMVKYFETSTISADINTAVKTSGFKDLNDFVDTSLRLTSASLAISSQFMPLDAALQTYETQLAEAKSQKDASPEMITMLQDMIEKEKAKLKSSEDLLKYATDADKKFLSENADWFAKMMEDSGL